MIKFSKDILDQFIFCLRNKKPISLVRYGDGEAMILNGYKDVESIRAIYKRQFGFTPTLDQIDEIRLNLISAYKNCDIIGSPLGKKIKDGDDSYWARSIDILRIEAGIDLLTTDKTNVSIDIHSEFLDKNYYHLLMENTDTINYISCRDLDEPLKRRYPNRRINKFIIQSEMKFSDNKTGQKHYPDQFREIERWMDRGINSEGALCLVGAGFVGKIYCNWFRDRGGVAMDIGSIMDSWAGYETRGSNRGFNVLNDKHKL